MKINPIPPFTPRAAALFHARYEKGDGCWLWTAAANKQGCGSVTFRGRKWRSTRVAWFLATGSDPGVMYVCHRCDNPRCVRPDHLFLGTARDNMRDMAMKGRQGNQRLSNEHVRQILSLAQSGKTNDEIAAEFEVSPSTISTIARRKSWRIAAVPGDPR